MLKTVRALVVMLALVVSASSAFAQKAGVGTWDLTTISPEGEFKSTLVVREEGGKLVAKPIEKAVKKLKLIDPSGELVRTAKGIGIELGG